MGSPFKTAEDYLNATGALHSFVGHPGTAGIFLIIAALLTLYFLIMAFVIKH